MAAHGLLSCWLGISLFFFFIYLLFFSLLLRRFYMRATYRARLFRAGGRHWSTGVTWPLTVFAMKSAVASRRGPKITRHPENGRALGPRRYFRGRYPVKGPVVIILPVCCEWIGNTTCRRRRSGSCVRRKSLRYRCHHYHRHHLLNAVTVAVCPRAVCHDEW